MAIFANHIEFVLLNVLKLAIFGMIFCVFEIYLFDALSFPNVIQFSHCFFRIFSMIFQNSDFFRLKFIISRTDLDSEKGTDRAQIIYGIQCVVALRIN